MPGRFAPKAGFRQIAKPRLLAGPVLTANDGHKGRGTAGTPAIGDLGPHELSIRPNSDLDAIEFEVADRDGRGFVITIYAHDLPEILLDAISAWGQLRS
jgi:hypothetical protein